MGSPSTPPCSHHHRDWEAPSLQGQTAEAQFSLTSPQALREKGHSLLAQKFPEHLRDVAHHYSQLEKCF